MTALSLPSSPSDRQPESYPAAACLMQDKPVLVLPLDTSCLICKPDIGSELFFFIVHLFRLLVSFDFHENSVMRTRLVSSFPFD